MKKPETYFEINELVSRLCDLQERKDFNFCNAIATIFHASKIEIVRCKDCKYCVKWDNYNPPQYTCRVWTDQWDMSTEPNGYCHYGELKDQF